MKFVVIYPKTQNWGYACFYVEDNVNLTPANLTLSGIIEGEAGAVILQLLPLGFEPFYAIGDCMALNAEVTSITPEDLDLMRRQSWCRIVRDELVTKTHAKSPQYSVETLYDSFYDFVATVDTGDIFQCIAWINTYIAQADEEIFVLEYLTNARDSLQTLM